MNQIYERHLWGGTDFDFYSGYGSHQFDIVNPYVESVIEFLKSHEQKLSICDLGCGDFNVGQHLVVYSKTYTAIDIVDDLIERNKQQFQDPKLEFQCLNIVEDDLPKSDIVILRQVLQHLSNAEIMKIVEKLSQYRFIILTEHIPVGDFISNKDIITGQGIRLKQNSGVDVLAEPFGLQIKEETVLNTVILEDGKEQITTIVYKINNLNTILSSEGRT
ncbi:class I SAM-dependent methyltransferase [Winogradskyella maritima]|uniref:Class I SAM-dependent methyltransferase n=1 Tax=Winogradskyella maritima TaxID=1517766 RepID=A0ABV8ACR7_9FLAO|nr:class I SAM-dependent methyltransferase [Winogradskyella maritima]